MKNTTTTKRTNRFFARNIKRAALAPRSPRVAIAAPEIDALESRLLLSGIVAGKDYKKLSYTDFDGDKVTISMNKGTFQVNGVFDGNTVLSLDELKVTSGDSSAVLKVTVAKVKPTSDGIGITNIGVINTNNAALRGIQLDGATVDQTNAQGTSLQFMTLQAKAAIQLDRNSAGGFGATEEVNFGTVTAKSLTLLQAANAPQSLVTNGQFLLNLNGPITVAEGTTSIVARTGAVNGALNVANLGNLNVADLNAPLTTAGDLTLNVANGASISGAGTITVGGNLHLSVLSGGLNFINFNVAGSISGGDKASETDAVSIAGNLSFLAFNSGLGGKGGIAGLSVTGGDVSTTNLSAQGGLGSLGDISVTGGNANFGDLDGSVIGKISATGDLSTGDITSGSSIGAITGLSVSLGDVEANNGGIGLISSTSKLSGGDNVAAAGIFATGKIEGITSTGSIVITNALVSETEIGALTATAGSIVANDIEVGVAQDDGKSAATGGNLGALKAGTLINADILVRAGGIASITAGGDVNGSITVGTGNGKAATDFAAVGGDLGKVTITDGSLNAGVEVLKGQVVEVNITNGSLNGDITVGSAKNDLIKAAAVGGNIGPITVSSTNDGVTSISADLQTVVGNIGDITVTNSGNTIGGDVRGITGVINSAGSIGKIDVTLSGADNDAGGNVAVALNNNITAVTSITSVSGKGTGAGGIGAGTITITGATIGDVTVSGTESKAKEADAQATLGDLTVGSITATTGTGSIGNITITGSLGGELNLNARQAGGGFAGGTLGNVVMTSNPAKANNLVVDMENIIKAGNISLTGGTGLLTIDHVGTGGLAALALTSIGNITSSDAATLAISDNSKLTTFGDISIGKALTQSSGADAFATATAIGKFAVGSIADAGTIGAGGASSIGLITIGSSATAGAVVFNFGNYNGQTTSTATVVGTITTLPATVTELKTNLMPQVVDVNFTFNKI